MTATDTVAAPRSTRDLEVDFAERVAIRVVDGGLTPEHALASTARETPREALLQLYAGAEDRDIGRAAGRELARRPRPARTTPRVLEAPGIDWFDGRAAALGRED